jgi:hypothetical protein
MTDINIDAENAPPPRRLIDKQEAVRHLIHCAIRLIQKEEDPFAVHLLVHSADKMLIDLAAKRGQELKADWELYIKPEYHKPFFKKHRTTYNYFKHAKEDFADGLPVHDIMMLNVMMLFMCMVNYAALFKELTNHMLLFQVLVLNLVPALIKIEDEKSAELFTATRMSQGMTPREFFELFDKNRSVLPKYNAEMSKDLEDVIDFYNLSFRQLQAGEAKSTRILRIPEY